MLERERNKENSPDKIQVFATQLAAWDRDIVEVIVLPNSDDETPKDVDKIDLVCTFDPEPMGENQGYIRVINLAIRDDHEGVSEKMGITQFIDLGFVMKNEIHLANGEIMEKPEDSVVLWSVKNQPEII